MSKFDTAIAYQQSAAFGASAVGQVVALYDRILRDLREASQAVEAGHIENRVNALNHALTIIGELQGVLDYEHGGHVARNLNDFYNVSRGMIFKAGLTKSLEQLSELTSMFTRLRAAWAVVERTETQSAPTERLRISNYPEAARPQNAGIPAETTPGSGGGWRA